MRTARTPGNLRSRIGLPRLDTDTHRRYVNPHRMLSECMRVIPVLHDGTLAVVSVFQTDLMDVSKLGSKIVSHNEVLAL